METPQAQERPVRPVARPRVEADSVFLNVPYDAEFRELYLAYIVGLIELGLTPKATLGIPSGSGRLGKILALIQSCRSSIHDLSRCELDTNPPHPTPRFNMPFELGLAVAWSKLTPKKHDYFVFETVTRRAQKSLSDLNEADLQVHQGAPSGVMRELCNAFVRRIKKPDVPQMLSAYHELSGLLPELMKQSGAQTVFEAGMFSRIITVSTELRNRRLVH